MSNSEKQTILTGVRSNEEPTLGNYLGAFLPMVELQQKYSQDYQINMFVPDLHSFTTPIDHDTLYQNTLKNISYFIGAGLDIKNPSTFLYRQSYVSAHSELAWILDCFTYVGEMQRMTQFKEKSSEHSASVTMGLMNYPVLMAADILLYNAKWVPVGEDQFQHLEIARDIATRFNNKFGPTFIVPESTDKQTSFISRDNGLRIRSLTNPLKKMSKSSNDEKSKINLADTPDVARKKIMSATTDSEGVINLDWDKQPGISNLMQIMATLRGESLEYVASQWQGVERYGDLKKKVAETVEEFLVDFHNRINQVSREELIQYLEKSESEVSKTANATLLRAQQAVGLRPKGDF